MIRLIAELRILGLVREVDHKELSGIPALSCVFLVNSSRDGPHGCDRTKLRPEIDWFTMQKKSFRTFLSEYIINNDQKRNDLEIAELNADVAVDELQKSR